MKEKRFVGYFDGRKLSVKLGERVQFKVRRNIIGFDKLRAAASLLLMGGKTAGNSGGEFLGFLLDVEVRER